MRALVIGHDHVAGIEHLGTELERRGFELDRLHVVPYERFTRPDVTFRYPGDPQRWDLVVTLGAPWPRTRIASWTRAESEFLARAHGSGTRVLGICFGAQLLAETLGATPAGALPAARIGWRPVVPRVAEVDAGPWFQWHADQLTRPPGAEVLAESEDGPEGFRLDGAIGFQFHPEMTPQLLDRWLELPGGPPAGTDVDALRARTREHAPRATAGVAALLDLL